MSGRLSQRCLITLSIVIIVVLGVMMAVQIRLPVSAALWLIETYPDYFESETPNTEFAKYSILDKTVIRGLSYKLLRDWAANSETTETASDGAESNTISKTVASVEDAVTYTRKLVLTQGQVPHESIEEPSFVRLMRGYSYCNGVNQLLGLVLADRVGSNDMFNTRYPLTGVSSGVVGKSTHTLVRVNVNGVGVYADAWSSIPFFKIKDEENSVSTVPMYEELAVKVSNPAEFLYLSSIKTVGALITELDSLNEQELSPEFYETILQESSGGLLRKSAYENGIESSLTKKTWVRFGRFQFAESIDSSKYLLKYGDDPKRLFRVARVLHVYGYDDSAATIYRYVKDSGCSFPECRAADMILDRNRW